MIKAVFFDFDGVLTTEESGAISTCKILEKNTNSSYQVIYKNYQKIFTGKDLETGIITPEKWEKACNEIGEKIPFSLLEYAMGHPPANNEIIDLISKLKPQYKIGLITDNPNERVNILKETFNLNELFETITVSSEIKSVKTEKKIFNAALDDMGVLACESVFIDNRQKNLVVPQSMGFKTCLYDHEVNDIDDLKKKLISFGVII